MRANRHPPADRRRPGLRAAVLGAALCVAAGVLADCTYRGRDDAISQRFTWFSYVNGDDIRAACTAGSRDRFRFVYNGVYVRQARTYDFVPADRPSGSGESYMLRARVLGPSDLSNVSIDPGALIDDPLDILAPFAGDKARIALSGRDIDALTQALVASGFFQPPPRGLYLRSEDFFWVGVACIRGRVVFNAWRYPSPGFAALTFPQLLFDWDTTGVPVNPPRDLSTFDIYRQATVPDSAPRFTLTVGENGLSGAP